MLLGWMLFGVSLAVNIVLAFTLEWAIWEKRNTEEARKNLEVALARERAKCKSYG